MELQRLSYDVGTSNLLQLVDAQRSHQRVRLGEAQAAVECYHSVARLAVAMGGGWWEAAESERLG